MSAYNVVLQPSRYARYGLMLLALVPLLTLAALPVPLLWFVLLAPCLLAYYLLWYRQLQQLQSAAAFTLTDTGELFWSDRSQAPGRLNGGLISQHAIKLCWQQQGTEKRQQRWIFADQCSDSSFRALARAINQLNWQANSSKN